MMRVDYGVAAGVFVGVFVLVLAVNFYGWRRGRASVRADAIQHNAAEWTVDPQTGDVEFRWKTETEDA